MLQSLPEAPDALGQQQVLNCPPEVGLPIMERLNERGHGIFWCPSTIGGGRRLIDNVSSIMHLWADFDGTPLPERWSLEPHAVVSTSPGKWHVYWLVEGLPQDTSEHRRLLRALAELHGADLGANGSNRCLRLPGYYHLKREPYIVTLQVARHERAWKYGEVLEAWHALKPPQPRRRPASATPADSDQEAAEVLSAETGAVRRARSGTRHTALIRAAFILGTRIGAGALDGSLVERELLAAALEAGLPQAEAGRAITDGIRAGSQHPRSAAEKPPHDTESPHAPLRTFLASLTEQVPTSASPHGHRDNLATPEAFDGIRGRE